MMTCGSNQLHDDEREPLIVVQHVRHQTGRQPRLMRQRQIFVMRARQRQRPAFADETHVWQRLLDGDAARGSLDDEHEIEIAIANLDDRPGSGRAAQPDRDRRDLCEVIPQLGLMKNPVFVLPQISHRSLLETHHRPSPMPCGSSHALPLQEIRSDIGLFLATSHSCAG